MPITPITPSGSNAPNDLPSDAAGAVAVPNTLPSDVAGAVAVPNTLPADAAGAVAVPNTLPSDVVGAVAVPNTLPADVVGNVASPNTLPSDAAGTVATPNTLPSDAAGSVASPVLLPSVAAVAVAVPNALPADAVGSVATPNALPADAVGSVASPVLLPSVAAAAVPRTLTPMVNLDFAAKSYARKGRTVLFDDLLTYTRPSSATFINRRPDEDGGYEYFLDTDYVGDVTNLVTYSEDFSNAGWGKDNLSASHGLPVAVTGLSNTSDKLIEANTSALHRMSQTITVVAGNTYTLSGYFKAAERSVVVLNANSVFGARGSVDLLSGAVVTSSGEISAIPVSDGWHRVVAKGVAATSQALGFYIHVNKLNTGTDQSYQGDGTSGLYAWGVQVTESSKALPYVKTLASVTQTFTETLRVEYDAVTGKNLGALIESGSTNLALHSEDFSNAAWNNLNCPITTNAAIAPDRTLSANKMTPSTTSGVHRVKQAITITSGNTYTHSLYCKPTGYNFLEVGFYISQVGEYSTATVNLTDGSFTELITGTSFTNVSVIVKKVNDYFKITVTATIAGVTADAYIRINNGSGTTFVGDGTSGVYAWGAQVEQLPFASSYIRTDGSAVSRSADDLSLPSAGNFNASEYTLAVDYTIKVDSEQQYLAVVGGITSADAIVISSQADNTIRHWGKVQGSSEYLILSGVVPRGSHSSSTVYNNNSAEAFLNGVSIGSDSNAVIIDNFSHISLGYWEGVGSGHLFGHISKFKTYAQALTAQEITLL